MKILVKDASKHLIEELEQIIPDNDNIFSNFEIFNFDLLKQQKQDTINSYGNEKIKRLMDYYISGNLNSMFNDQELILSEWGKVKHKIINEFKKDSKFTNELYYILNNPYFQHAFENIKRLIEIYCALPSSNAEIERGFSAMSRIKTLSRNKLLTENLDNLMIISLIGEDVKDFNPDSYIKYWLQTNNIRNLE